MRPFVIALLIGGVACRQTSDLYCDTNADCTDPERPVCDVDGTTPGSDGVGHTCVPSGIDDEQDASVGIADASPSDARTDGASVPDATMLYELTVVKTGTGDATISANLAGIECGADCSESYASGTMLSLGFALEPDTQFAGWSGACEGMAPTCDVTLDTAKTVTARFESGRVIEIAVGGGHTCALLNTGVVRCWGRNFHGQLGYGYTSDIGDDEYPYTAGDVDLPRPATAITAGGGHTCALLDTREVFCWGQGDAGQLGYGNTDDIGDNETPGTVGPVDVGEPVYEISAGGTHTCARLNTGTVRCWGEGIAGRLGYGSPLRIGDDETPASVGDVPGVFGVIAVAAGGAHTCVRLGSGAVQCWGSGNVGQLGHGNTDSIGDDEFVDAVGPVPVGGSLGTLAMGYSHTCAWLGTDTLRCWGAGMFGRLGYGNEDNVGDDETPADVGDIDLGATSWMWPTGGIEHTCAEIDGGAVRCWGRSGLGQTGYGSTATIGDDETPASAGNVDIGGFAIRVRAGGHHTCVLLDRGAVRCWGWGSFGQLGYGNVETIGDDETPATAGDVPLF